MTLALTTNQIQEFAFDWYPVFGVIFMAMLLFVFFRLVGCGAAGDQQRDQRHDRARRQRPGR